MVALLRPKRRSLHATITPAFGLSLVLIALVASLAYKSTTRLIAAGQNVGAAQEILARLSTAGTFFERAEVDFRGFVVTGDASLLDRMHVALAQTADGLHSVRESSSDNPSQQQNLDQLNSALAMETAQIQRLTALRSSQGFERRWPP